MNLQQFDIRLRDPNTVGDVFNGDIIIYDRASDNTVCIIEAIIELKEDSTISRMTFGGDVEFGMSALVYVLPRFKGRLATLVSQLLEEHRQEGLKAVS